MNETRRDGTYFRFGVGAVLILLCMAVSLPYAEVDFLLPGLLWALALFLAIELTPPRYGWAPAVVMIGAAFWHPSIAYFVSAMVPATRRFGRIGRAAAIAVLVRIASALPSELLVISAVIAGLSLIFEQLEERYQSYRSDYIAESDAHRIYERMLTETEARKMIEVEQRSRESVLAERNRIARALHDYIGHTISSAIMQLEAYKAVFLEEGPQPAPGIVPGASAVSRPGADRLDAQRRQIETVVETLRSGMVDIRSGIHHLHDESFDLESRLDELILRYPRLKIFTTLVDTEGLSFEQKTELLRIFGELIANTVRHSDAQKMWIIVSRVGGSYAVTVRDDGSRDPGPVSMGIGLRGMRSFAESNGGSFDCGYDRGFYVHMRIRAKHDPAQTPMPAAHRAPAESPLKRREV